MALTQDSISAELLTGDNCRIIRTDSAEAAATYIARFDFSRFKRCRRLELTGGARLNPEFYNSLEQELNRRIFTYWQTKASLTRMGSLWFRNIFRNMPILSENRPVSSLKVEGPIILCGAGESLEESLPLLKRYRNKVFLCAVDTAYPVLTAKGIIPDAVFNLDGQFYNFYDFYHHRDNPLYLISDITSFPASLRLPGVTPLLFSSLFSSNDLLDRLNQDSLLPAPVYPLGSVGVTALHLCTMLGEGPYLLTGLDFSYKIGKSHARGTVYHQLYLSRNNRKLPDGGMTELSLRRPPREIRGQLTGRKLRCDTVLHDYYRMFLQLTEKHGDRCFQLSRDYPSLGIPLADESVLDTLTTGESRLHSFTKEEPGKDWKGFLENESARLNVIIEAWEEYSRGGNRQKLEDSLVGCDYLTMTTGLDGDGQDGVFFTQAVRNARQYLSFISHCLLWMKGGDPFAE